MPSQEPADVPEEPYAEDSDDWRPAASGYTGSWSIAGGLVPVWVDNDGPPPLIESDKHDPLPSVLDRLGLQLRSDEPK